MPGIFRIRHLIFVALIMTVLNACVPSKEKSIVFQDLRTENIVNPVGLEVPDPGFSWIVIAGDYNRSQSAYLLEVASSPGILEAGNADLWSSGKVESGQSVLIPYRGRKLETGRIYFWRVKIWDEEGKQSSWSDTQHFEMGLLNGDDWKNAEWISAPLRPDRLCEPSC